jgi:hypothetical protein
MANLVMEFSEDEIQMISYMYNYMYDRQNEGSLSPPPYINNDRLHILLEETRQSIDKWYRDAELSEEEEFIDAHEEEVPENRPMTWREATLPTRDLQI